MRIRILKSFVSAYGGFNAGAVIDMPSIPHVTIERWCKVGLAMQDKSLDGAKETKAESTPIKQKRNSRR